ncbi:TIR domain protein [Agrobacterium sp. DSM 25558]|uniref:toll/interleukin-1 receptor domain-containing protein n=1 Tax=Agrobacterium sp. DSM 25558 TaxID=1907665 RepID=UPI0009725226|nr:toll/interleukin-1 receptor domain-containing protein [Agrobacterium sp. DSM 25558]SCX26107.1 TIR domain protein [Agrobacterium sp. DSM 25558]
MTKIFISHSTSDNIFVQKLAADLVEADLPVWIDKWELGLGSPIFETVLAEINVSAYLILVLSPRSIRSEWVQKEIELALAQEQKLGRVLLVPVMLEECEVPEYLKDRVHASASENYYLCLEQLISFFRSNGVKMDEDSDSRLLVLRPQNGYHLNQAQIDRAIQKKSNEAQRNWAPNELLIVDDGAYAALRDDFLATCSRFKADPKLDPAISDATDDNISRLRRIESAIIPGVIEIVNKASEIDKAVVSAIFFKILRTEAIMRMNRMAPEHAIDLPYKLDWPPLGSSICSAAFYGDKQNVGVDVYDKTDRSKYFSILADRSCSDLEHVVSGLQVPVNDSRGSRLFNHYLLPQMLAKHFYSNASTSPLEWDFNDWMIGLN